MCFDNLPLYEKLCKFIDVGHSVMWDIIDFAVKVIIPFVDVSFHGIFNILIYSFDISPFKVWLSIEFFL